MSTSHLEQLTPGMPVPYGGDRVALVSPELAERFRPGDRLLVVHETGDLLHIPAQQHEIAAAAVGRAHSAFGRMGSVTDEQISRFFHLFSSPAFFRVHDTQGRLLRSSEWLLFQNEVDDEAPRWVSEGQVLYPTSHGYEGWALAECVPE